MAGYETDRLAERCATMARDGMVDFHVSMREGGLPATTNSVSGDVNAVLDALEGGYGQPFSFGDSRRAAIA